MLVEVSSIEVSSVEWLLKGCSCVSSLRFNEFGEAETCRFRVGVCCPAEYAGQRATINTKKGARIFTASAPQVNCWDFVASNMR